MAAREPAAPRARTDGEDTSTAAGRDDLRLEVRGIHKSFPGVRALENVSFRVRRGSVHALCGENGAGKSTLMKVINGIHQPDAGRIFVDGREVQIGDPMAARDLGIAMIAQELSYVPDLTVAENLFLGRLPKRAGRVDWRSIHEQTQALLDEEQLPYRPDQKLRTLTVSDIQILEILRAIHQQANILIMDEPTSAIAQRDVERLFRRIEALRADGVAIVYISHKMDEVFQIADDVTVLRDGSVVSSDPASEITVDDVIARMVGRKLDNQYPKETIELGDTVLEAHGLHRAGTFTDIDLQVRAGEIVGLAGLIGAGRSEVVRAVFGLDPLDGGEVRVGGEKVDVRDPRRAIEHGIAMLSEDRRGVGIIPQLSVRKNATLANLKRVIFGGRSRTKLEGDLVETYVDRMRVKTPSIQTPIENLSGGNQQKVLLIRWLLTDPKVLLLDEPTRGIDVGAKREIYGLMNELAAQGIGILMISSELPELIGMCDRIYVMSGGRLTGELDREDFSQEEILKYAMSEIA
ncbi:sugar ABC transporter ATP-binding protein [Nitriliruptoraceae bacterium ZYF776]|nr:sugar ABC transporter ATP-binding protein [Profundirhabdus halotolerans]